MIRGLSEKHQSEIEGLQPFKRGNGGRNSALHLLQEINNADKHRLIQVVGAKAGAISTGWWGDDPSPLPTFDLTSVLNDGAVIARVPEGMHVSPTLHPLIAFSDGCEAVRGHGVTYLMEEICDHVRGIVKHFEPEFR